jgi:hypothetical protein
MRISKRHLRRIIRESCALPGEHDQEILPLPPSTEAVPDVPVPEDYDAARELLSQNPDLVDFGISMVMDLAGTSCERSTAQGIIDHLQDMLHGREEDEFSFTGDVEELSGDEAFGIGYEAGRRGLE